jgi:nucleotide-binding universal stress UspA family protein
MRVQTPDGAGAAPSGKHATGEHAIQAAARTAKIADPDDAGATPAKVEVITRAADASTGQAVASEASKGYDLLVVGVENMAVKGQFHDDANHIAAQFQGPLAIVAARGVHLQEPTKGRLNILVPVTGTRVSRQAMEVGIVLARATRAPITALYVSAGKPTRMARRLRNAVQPGGQEEIILKDAVEMADRYGIEMRTAVKTDVAAEDAILRQAGASRQTLIVMGVNRRSGDTLFFGNVAAAVLERSSRSIMFVSSSGSISTAPSATVEQTQESSGPPEPKTSPEPKTTPSRSKRSRQSP